MTQVIVTRKIQPQIQVGNRILQLAEQRGFKFLQHEIFPALGLEADVFTFTSLFRKGNRILELADQIRNVAPGALVHEIHKFTIPKPVVVNDPSKPTTIMEIVDKSDYRAKPIKVEVQTSVNVDECANDLGFNAPDGPRADPNWKGGANIIFAVIDTGVI
jgi:hypothetical protein